MRRRWWQGSDHLFPRTVEESPRETLDSHRRAERALLSSGEIGPLHGVPVALKDDLAVKGVRYTCGSNLMSEVTAEYDDLTVQRLRSAGAVILGKTNLPEFGHKGTTDNL